MKSLKYIASVAVCALFFTSCLGDHPAKNGKDTINNTYKVAKDSSVLDTAKASPTDAQATDQSAAGGTKIPKDTGSVKK